jgi:hypothetical protein
MIEHNGFYAGHKDEFGRLRKRKNRYLASLPGNQRILDLLSANDDSYYLCGKYTE